MSWKSEDLWQKARLYFARAFSIDREDSLFPLWSSLALELTARSALAKVHPALLADPQQGENVLYACGYPSSSVPKSIPAKTVFHRLTVIAPGFSDADFKFCTALMQMRNAELHSGELPFDKYPAKNWFPQLCRIAKLLTEFCGQTLEDLFGTVEAKAAEEMIKAFEAKLHEEVNASVKNAKEYFEALGIEERLQRIKALKTLLVKHTDWKSKHMECPGCRADGILHGEVLKTLDAKATEEGIEERSVIMPTKFTCLACNLLLPSAQHLLIVGMAEHFMVTTTMDPKDYYGIEFDPSEYYEEDYGND
jgi:hypothetical protein